MSDEQVKDHPDQAIDTDLPDDKINRSAFKALKDEYDGEAEGEFEDYVEEDES